MIRSTESLETGLLVRVGLFGEIGRFARAEGVPQKRGTRVVCRTKRGLEIGTVLAVDEVELKATAR